MTVTSNLHINLPGWSNATYAIGQRRGNAGNAYQCIIAGTSTSPPTGTGSNIAPGGTAHWKWLSTIDYTTLQAWANGIPATLTQPVIGLIWNDATPTVTATAGVTLLTLSGHSNAGGSFSSAFSPDFGSSLTNTITLRAAPGDSFQSKYQAAPTTRLDYGNANGVSIECPATGFGGVNYIQVNDSYVIFDGIQLRDFNPSSGATIIGGTGANISIQHCIIEGTGQAGGASLVEISGSNLAISNCLILDGAATAVGPTVLATGSGASIANCTVFRAAFATNGAALDAGANIVTASNTVTNCILINYDKPFVAASGVPWAASHNAYTNASFTSSNGTDTGGSLYGITTAATFINTTIPTPDYHLKPGASCINAGMSDVADIPSADDIFGITRPQGIAWDIGAHEVLSGSFLIRDFVAPMEFKNTISLSLGSSANPFSGDFSSDFGGSALTSGIPLEWNIAKVIPSDDFQLPIEWQSGVLIDKPTSIDSQSPVSRNVVVPAEFSLSTPNIFRNVSVPLEWRNTTLLDQIANADWRSTQNVNSVTPTYSQSTVIASLGDIINPWSVGFSLDFGGMSPAGSLLEWGTLYQSDSTTFPLDLNTSATVSLGVPAEWTILASLVSDMRASIEWMSHVGVARDATIGIDWLSPLVKDQVFVTDRSLSVVLGSATSSEWVSTQAVGGSTATEWGLSVRTDLSAPTELGGGLGISIVTSMPLDFGLTARRDLTTPLDTGLAVISDVVVPIYSLLQLARDTTAPTEPLAARVVDARLSLEISGGRSSATDAVVPIEWGRVVAADAGAPDETGAGVRADVPMTLGISFSHIYDTIFSSAWGGGVAGDAVASVEWGHLTLSFQRDAIFPLEILTTVITDLVVSYHYDIVRHSYGSQLEPDEWERQHEPDYWPPENDT